MSGAAPSRPRLPNGTRRGEKARSPTTCPVCHRAGALRVHIPTDRPRTETFYGAPDGGYCIRCGAEVVWDGMKPRRCP